MAIVKASSISRYSPLPTDRYLSFLRRVHLTGLETESYLFSWTFFFSQKTRPVNMTAVNTAFTVFSGIGFILSVIPVYWHLESWSVGTGMYMIWTALGCLVHFVDSIVWSGNAINRAPVWCDIGMFTRSFTRLLCLTNPIQLFVFNSLLLSHGPLAVSALSVASTLSLPPAI